MAEEEEQVPLDSFLNGNQELLDQKVCFVLAAKVFDASGGSFMGGKAGFNAGNNCAEEAVV